MPASPNWWKFATSNLWPQLKLIDDALYRLVKSPTMVEEWMLIVVPHSLQRSFLKDVHDQAGYQGMERILDRLAQTAY